MLMNTLPPALHISIFSRGKRCLPDGRAFCCGQRIGATGLERWIRQNAIVVDKSRFASKELTMRDFVLALVRTNHLRQRFPSTERLTSLAATDMLHRMGLNLPWSTRLIDLSMLDYYRLSIFRAWFNGYKLLVLDRLTETLRRQDLAKLMDCVQLLLRHGTAVFLFDMDEAFMFRYASRIDVIRDRRTFFRLYPEEYGPRLFELLGWEGGRGVKRFEHTAMTEGAPCFLFGICTFPHCRR